MRIARKIVSRAGSIVAVAALVVGGLATDARAHAGDGDPTKIHACVATKGGKVRFVGADASLSCKRSESPLHFNIQGAPGAPGAVGTPGRIGRSALTPLGPGETVSGVWGASLTASFSGELYRAFTSFPIPLEVDLPAENRIYVAGESAPNCPGRGQAASGFLCVYQGFTQNAGTPENGSIFDPSINGAGGVSRFGFGILLESATPGISAVSGTFSVTAP